MRGPPPTTFHDFELVRPLGAGSMGTVYVARDRRLSRLVAIKFIATDCTDAHARERFAREARTLARCQHPNVVSLYRVGAICGRPYLVCELISGLRLDQLRQPLGWPEGAGIALGLARAVAAAHACGVIHRDIKPANVMISDDGVVKLLDFGLAMFADHGDHRERVMEIGLVAGTPLYLAPELWSGRFATPRTDLYALGLVLHELLGRDLAKLPSPLVRMIDECMQIDPGARPTSAANGRDELAPQAVSGPGRWFPQAPRAAETRVSDLRGLIGDLATQDGVRA
jgi:serine/threonine protein kinase